MPKKLQDEDAFPEYDALDFEDSPDEYVPKKTSRRSRGKSKKASADSEDSDEWQPGAEDEVEEPFDGGNIALCARHFQNVKFRLHYTVW